MAEDRCVCCGEVVAEGVQVCLKCQEQVGRFRSENLCGQKDKVVEGLEWILNDITNNEQYQVALYPDVIQSALWLICVIDLE